MELEAPEGQAPLGESAQPPADLLAGNPRYEKVSGAPGAEGGDRAGPPVSGLRGSSTPWPSRPQNARPTSGVLV